MSKIVELYVRELTREGSTMTINDVPKKLRKQVEDAIAAIEAAANAGTAKEGPRAQVSRRHGLLRRRRGVSPTTRRAASCGPPAFMR